MKYSHVAEDEEEEGHNIRLLVLPGEFDGDVDVDG